MDEFGQILAEIKSLRTEMDLRFIAIEREQQRLRRDLNDKMEQILTKQAVGEALAKASSANAVATQAMTEAVNILAERIEHRVNDHETRLRRLEGDDEDE